MDPLVGVTGAAYGYVGGDPINFADLSGLQSSGPCGLGYSDLWNTIAADPGFTPEVVSVLQNYVPGTTASCVSHGTVYKTAGSGGRCLWVFNQVVQIWTQQKQLNIRPVVALAESITVTGGSVWHISNVEQIYETLFDTQSLEGITRSPVDNSVNWAIDQANLAGIHNLDFLACMVADLAPSAIAPTLGASAGASKALADLATDFTKAAFECGVD